MDLDYIGTGFINFCGCPKIDIEKFRYHKWGIGTKVYDKISARKGYLESTIVRKILFRNTNILYKNGDNWLYNEADLCTQAEAISIVSTFYQNKLNDINVVLNQLNCC